MALWWLGANMKPMPVLDALGDGFWLEVDVDAQRLQHVGAAALAGHAAPAVLADLGARSRRHEHRAGGDVERVRAVAAGAHDVHQVRAVGHVDLGGELAHHLRRGGDLANGFLLDAQAGDERGHHHRRQLAAHDHAHDLEHLVVEDLAVLDGALQRFLGGDGHGGLHLAPDCL
jgi:hypothetical protein